jgi:poly(3-hydroxybutyrate) depolymerase
VRRRTLLFGLAGSAGAGGGLAVRAAPASASGATGASAIFASTKTSTLQPRPVLPLRPVEAEAPAPVRAVRRQDHVFARDGRPLHTRVWCPAGPGPYPVVVFSHGLRSQPDDYAALLVSWALAGFVVAAPLYPHTALGAAAFNSYDIANQPADASAVLTQLLASPLKDRIDPTRLAAAGHSAGGITTAGLFSEHRDPRLTAGIILAGTDFLGSPFAGPPAALLFVHGTQDRTVSYTAARTVFAAAPWSRAMLTVGGGGHQTAAREFAAVSGTGAAFLRWSMFGGSPSLAAPAALGGVATLEDQLG